MTDIIKEWLVSSGLREGADTLDLTINAYGFIAGVEAAISIIEDREKRVHSGSGGALQPDRTIAEIRERLLNG